MSSEWSHLLEILMHKFFTNSHQEFDKLSCEMKVFYCYRNLGIKRMLSQWIEDNVTRKTAKSSSLSEEFRTKGNKKFKIADDETSLTLYSRSVIYAPYGSIELSLALGNRSAVLFRQQKYEECIRDIDFAIKNYENPNLYPKLMIRKIKSLSRMGQREMSLQCFNSFKESIASTDALCFQKQLEECENELNHVSLPAATTSRHVQLPQLQRGENESFASASNSLRLELRKENDDRHRQVIACETIEAGDIIFVEKPFSFVLLTECNEEYCQVCCKPLIAPVACPVCIDFLFCSHECMTKARSTYHQWECLGLNFLQNLGVGHLAFRTFLLTTLKPCKQVDELVTHLNDIPESDLLSYILTSTLLMVYLEEYTDFTNSHEELSLEGIGFSILKSMIQIICNAFAIKRSSDSLSFVTYASGLFPSAAMMNHSCEPNIITSFYDNILVVRASRRIERGKEVFNCYGPHFRNMKRETRIEILKNQFFFDCKCKHCQSTNEDDRERTLCLCLKCRQPFNINGYRLEETITCRSCSSAIDLRIYAEFFKQATELRERGVDSMNVGNYKEASQLLIKCERLQSTFLEVHNNEMFDNRIDLAECYFILGDYGNSWRKFYSNILIADERYGEFDVEFVTLISRTIDAYLFFLKKENGGKIDDDFEKLLNLADKMMKIVEINFGTWCKEYLALVEKKKTLMNLKSSVPGMRDDVQFNVF